MHYIRFLRPPSLQLSNPKRPVVLTLFTITTDLGDAFLYPDEPIQLSIVARDASSNKGLGSGLSLATVDKTALQWSAGLRVLNLKLRGEAWMATAKAVTLEIHAVDHGSQAVELKNSSDALPWNLAKDGRTTEGLIVPVSAVITNTGGSPISVRPFSLDLGPQFPKVALDLEEDIGESIARHVWDAGILMSAFFADACRSSDPGSRICDILPVSKKRLNILELGSGIGILGLSMEAIAGPAASIQDVKLAEATILLTDLPEAEERARSNIQKHTSLQRLKSNPNLAVGKLQYENLDWDDGKKGNFGPIAGSRFWDYIVLSDCTYNVDSLPALVSTLSALHTSNQNHSSLEKPKQAETTVILATKPRHSSEKALFGLLDAENWRYSVMKSIPLPKIGDEEDVVEIYRLKKGSLPLPSENGTEKDTVLPTPKRKGSDIEGQPPKRTSAAS